MCRMTSSAALRAAASAATCAAKGVPLRDPLNPHCPALDQTSVLPCRSVIVTIVLLNVEWMWSTPSDTERFAFLRRAGVSGFAAAPPSGSFAMLVPSARSVAVDHDVDRHLGGAIF